ncbi:MAG: MlaD family protein, partial [Chlamydiae bacterium]|nr:MlaD family protein [Chlamydiota bacterium]
MTSDKGKAFWLGIFVIIAISTVAWLFLFLKPTVGDGKTTLKIRFTNVEGITIGTRVSFGGKPVGTVTSIKEIPNAREEKPDPFGNYYFYEVTAKVDSKVRIYSYDQIALSTQGLLGEKLIEITPRATPIGAKPAVNITADVLFARSGDQIQSAIEDFSHLLGKVTSFLDQNMPLLKESMENINSAAEDFHELIEQAMDSQVVTKAASAASSVDSAMQKACSVLDEVKDNQLPARIAGAATTVEEAAG